MPPYLWSTTLGVVLHTGSAALKASRIDLSIKLHRDVPWGVLIPFAVGRVIPGHHTSAPKVATGTTHISTAVTIALGAAPRLTELNRRRCCAAFNALPHQVVR